MNIMSYITVDVEYVPFNRHTQTIMGNHTFLFLAEQRQCPDRFNGNEFLRACMIILVFLKNERKKLMETIVFDLMLYCFVFLFL